MTLFFTEKHIFLSEENKELVHNRLLTLCEKTVNGIKGKYGFRFEEDVFVFIPDIQAIKGTSFSAEQLLFEDQAYLTVKLKMEEEKTKITIRIRPSFIMLLLFVSTLIWLVNLLIGFEQLSNKWLLLLPVSIGLFLFKYLHDTVIDMRYAFFKNFDIVQ